MTLLLRSRVARVRTRAISVEDTQFEAEGDDYRRPEEHAHQFVAFLGASERPGFGRRRGRGEVDGEVVLGLFGEEETRADERQEELRLVELLEEEVEVEQGNEDQVEVRGVEKLQQKAKAAADE